MGLDFLKSGGSETTEVRSDDFVELDAETIDEDRKVVIKAETLSEYEDVEEVQRKLRDESIVWVNIKPLKNKEMSDLKRAVNRLKKTVKAVNGDMAGVDEDWIVVCPEYAKIERSEQTSSE